MITEEEIQIKLAEEIKLSGISQTKIARAIGVTQQTVSEYLNGKSLPSLQTFANLCVYLDVNPTYFIQQI